MVVSAMFVAIIILLLAMLIMLLTGWPGGRKKELETIGRELRRELAGHRADSVQALHAMKVELEDTVRQTVEDAISSVQFSHSVSSGTRGNGYRSAAKKQAVSSEVQVDTSAEGGSYPVIRIEEECKGDRDRQLSLFAVCNVDAVMVQESEYMVNPEDFDDLDNL
ncbi:MAG: hypothetical protein HGA72_00060 [Chlorobiaceae bacterium]|jgi:hypothetical protein|nr:hypothetical protein [Chlorobiaceae bacterium]NTW63321.1 hypothetical protein [Chlorobiaceae bacterium]